MGTLRRLLALTTAALALTACSSSITSSPDAPIVSSPSVTAAGATAASSQGGPKTDVTLATLKTAEVPAHCQLPAQRLVDGHARKVVGYGKGELVLDKGTFAFADVLGLGYRQGLVSYECSLGGPTRPAKLLLVGSGGTLLGWYDLATGHERMHADVNSLSSAGAKTTLTWSAYDTEGGRAVRHTAAVTFAGGELRVQDTATPYLDVAGTRADFVSPDGTYACSLAKQGVDCRATDAARKQAPTTKGLCKNGLDPDTLSLAGRASWTCRGNTIGWVEHGSPNVDWVSDYGEWKVIKGSGYPREIAVLPSGRTLVAGDLRCTMDASAAVTCRNERTKASFKLGKAGVTLG